jgi:hypothetical protein
MIVALNVKGIQMVNIVATGISEELLKVLEAQGLPVKRSLDIEIKPFPADITGVDDQELMEMARSYMENYNFLLTQVACAELAVAEADNYYKQEEAKLLIDKSSDPKIKATTIKAMILTDPNMQKLSSDRMHADAYHKLLKTTMDNLERYYQLTSRELTRRTSVLKARGY